MQEATLPSEVDQITPMMKNYDQIVRVGQNLGCLDKMIEDKYGMIKDAVRMVKMGGETLQAAVVCRVNKIKYPDEVMAKILQLKNIPFTDIEETPEYLHNQKRNYERYLFVSNKYLAKKTEEQAKSQVDDAQRFNEEAELLGDEGNNTVRSQR